MRGRRLVDIRQFVHECQTIVIPSDLLADRTGTLRLGGRVDAVFDLGMDALRYQASLTFPGRFKFLPLPDPPSDLYTLFARTARGAALVSLYNTANAKHAGSMPALIARYLAGKQRAQAPGPGPQGRVPYRSLRPTMVWIETDATMMSP